MARQTIGHKAERVLKLLLGLRSARVASALAAHGFTEQNLREGWQLLANLTRMRLGTRAPLKDARVLQELDEFENLWFPVAHATLDHRFPDVSGALFLNLMQTTGSGVAVSVGTFLQRLAEMERGEDAFDPNGPAARKLLVERGLTGECVAAAQALVDELAAIVEVADIPSTEQQIAEERLWAWYLEWSGIARVAVKDGRILRSLGFLQSRKGEDVMDVEGVAALPTATPAPAPGLSGAASPPALPVEAGVSD